MASSDIPAPIVGTVKSVELTQPGLWKLVVSRPMGPDVELYVNTAGPSLLGMVQEAWARGSGEEDKPKRWYVRDNITGGVASRLFDDHPHASSICRELNIQAGHLLGGRYRVEEYE